MHRGHITLHRCLEDDDLWLAEPFTKGQAWVDMILLANYKESVFSIRGNMVKVNRGQLGRSERFFQSRWQWSRNKVRAFMSYLEKVKKIEQQKTRIITIITIVKYDEYQTKGQQKVQQKDHRKTTEGTTYKKDNNINKKNKQKESSSFNFLQAIIDQGVNPQTAKDFLAVRKTKNATNSKTAFSKLSNQIKLSGKSWQQVIERCCEKDWKSFDASWPWEESQRPLQIIPQRPIIYNGEAF